MSGVHGAPGGLSMCSGGDRPLVFVNILTWNRRDEVLDAVRSLAWLEYPNYVPVVIDNGSRDDTVQALRREFPQLQIIANRRNLGYTGGNNVGIEYALARGAQYVLILNNDARVSRLLIDHMLRVMESDPRIAVVGPKNLYEGDPDRIWGAWASVTYGPLLTQIAGHGQRDGPAFSVVRDVPQVMGCGYMWRREALLNVGLLDPNFFGYHEDVDWCQRARNRGWRVTYCGRAVVYHKGGVSDDRRFKYHMPVKYFLGRNAILFARKHGRGRDLARLVCNSLIGSAGRAVRARLQRRHSDELEFVRGVLDGFLGRNSQPDFRAI